MKGLHIIACILIIIGALNWGLVGFFQYDLVASLLGSGDNAALLPRIIYAVVGLAAVWEIFTHKKNCKACCSSKSATV